MPPKNNVPISFNCSNKKVPSPETGHQIDQFIRDKSFSIIPNNWYQNITFFQLENLNINLSKFIKESFHLFFCINSNQWFCTRGSIFNPTKSIPDRFPKKIHKDNTLNKYDIPPEKNRIFVIKHNDDLSSWFHYPMNLVNSFLYIRCMMKYSERII